jgi:hypothetical protein
MLRKSLSFREMVPPNTIDKRALYQRFQNVTSRSKRQEMKKSEAFTSEKKETLLPFESVTPGFDQQSCSDHNLHGQMSSQNDFGGLGRCSGSRNVLDGPVRSNSKSRNELYPPNLSSLDLKVKAAYYEEKQGGLIQFASQPNNQDIELDSPPKTVNVPDESENVTVKAESIKHPHFGVSSCVSGNTPHLTQDNSRSTLPTTIRPYDQSV